MASCGECGGSGQIACIQCMGSGGKIHTDEKCQYCKGSGNNRARSAGDRQEIDAATYIPPEASHRRDERGIAGLTVQTEPSFHYSD